MSYVLARRLATAEHRHEEIERHPLRLLPATVRRMPSVIMATRPSNDGVPRYACGHCGATVLRAAPLKVLAAATDDAKDVGIRCAACNGVSFLQVISRLPQLLADHPDSPGPSVRLVAVP